MPCAEKLEDSKGFRPSSRWEQGHRRHRRKPDVQPNTCRECAEALSEPFKHSRSKTGKTNYAHRRCPGCGHVQRTVVARGPAEDPPAASGPWFVAV